jgi:hypothetical protein
MIVYTVHEPQKPGQTVQARAENIVFVREGFTLWGFLFGPLWLLYNRLWFEFVAALLLAGSVAAGLVEAGLQQQQAVAIADLLLALIVGFEGNDLVRWRLARKGYVFVASVAGKTLLECERRFFDAWVQIVRGGGQASAMDLRSGDWSMPHTVGAWPEPMV